MTLNRQNLIPLAGQSLRLPCFFPSISSVKTNLTPLEYLRILVAIKCPHFLISAYDVFNSSKKHSKEIASELKKAINNGSSVLMDSGNYESFWHRDGLWTRNKFHKILKVAPCSMAFCFDFQNDFENRKKLSSKIERSVLEDDSSAPAKVIIPIVHAKREILTEVVTEIVNRLRPLMVAIPERILGEGILSRAEKLSEIRRALNKLNEYTPIHLLGTGNPHSIAVFTFAGADSFDGLEWCQTAVDHKTGHLHHFQQREFVNCFPGIEKINLPYAQKTLVHNLLFYKQFMEELRAASNKKKLAQFVRRATPAEFYKKLIGVLQ